MDVIDKIMRFFSESVKATSKYFYTKLLTSLIVSVFSYLIFLSLEISLPGLLSSILGVTNLVPVFGPWVGVITCALISVFHNPLSALYTTLTAILLQLIEQFFLIPLLAGKSLDLKPLIVTVSLILGSMLFGFWGVVFAVPAAAAFKIGYRIFITEDWKRG